MAHEHSVVDTDALFTVDPLTMEITANGDIKALRQGDHAAEKYTFSMPRFVEGHDMTLCNLVEVHFNNTNVNSSTRTTTVKGSFYTVQDFGVAEGDESKVSFTWEITGDATPQDGKLDFCLRFACIGEGGVVEYEKFTEIFESIPVNKRIYNKEKIAADNVDALERFRAEILETVGKGSTATIGSVELLADKWEGENNLYSQVVEIEGVTPNSQVDLTPSVEQLTVFYEKDLTFVTENENGVVTVYAIGQKPTNDYTVQVTITEVSA
jgi:hypothetical protein